MSSGSEWMHQFFQQSLSHDQFQTQTQTHTQTQTQTQTLNLASDVASSSPREGRVTKPAARRRPRASRRTPTTLLNTDTANFRAMVQQFTGARQYPGGGTTTALVFPQGGAGTYSDHGNVQYYHQEEQQPQQQMFSLSNGGRGGGGFFSELRPEAEVVYGGSASSRLPPEDCFSDDTRNNDYSMF